MADVERPRPPALLYIIGLGVAALLLWWLAGAVWSTLAWLVRTALAVLVVGGIIWAVLTLLGRQPGRK